MCVFVALSDVKRWDVKTVLDAKTSVAILFDFTKLSNSDYIKQHYHCLKTINVLSLKWLYKLLLKKESSIFFLRLGERLKC